MMRKVILYIAMSLDGYIAKNDGSIDWLSMDVENPEVDTNYETFYNTIDTAVMGSKTYHQIINELAVDHYPYGDVMSYVFTSEEKSNEKKIAFINQDVSEFIREIRSREGGSIWIVGGSTIIAPLIRDELIDEYKIAILPIIVGKGIPLFPEHDTMQTLKVRSADLKNQITYLDMVKNNEQCSSDS